MGDIGMTITDVRVRKIAKDGKMKAIVSVTFDNEFVVHDIKVIEGEKGLFIAMPSRKTADGEYRDIAHPINSDTRQQLQEMILNEYEKAISTTLRTLAPIPFSSSRDISPTSMGFPNSIITCPPRSFGNCVSKRSLVPTVATGMMAHPVFVAILNEPS